ncbi:Sensor protein kinase WalK [Emticicia aquatica]|jgi:PAS domain S-box-containing protein|uniref:histidine kinase n=1 Tax=Emticicia aquatica TaxID=1681835 RepID=A0ABM9APU3_9BACT|nr:histidine kinase dimerization/phospho-acceptor domain-containing protein [Emticicia aquatica]CAH0995932.1 Sensor protein kinase WalK [Emticicia aquatica]
MKIKTKISLGLIFLFLAILLTGGLGVWYLHQLSADAKNILQDNYETLEYSKKMLESLEKNTNENKRFEQNLIAQEQNISEIGEKDVTQQLRAKFNLFKKDSSISHIGSMRQYIFQLMELNMNAIIRKNQVATKRADDAITLLSFVLAAVVLFTFSFIFNFPNYIAEPIAELTKGIKEIANKNYEQRLHFKANDEFGDLANAFNKMAEKLNNYEHSNLAELLFEKRRIEAIINNMNDAIIGLDEQNNVLFVNQIAVQILGLKESEIIGKYAPDIALNNDLLRSLLQNEASSNPIKIFADQKESYFTKDILAVKNAENTASGTVIILKNITKFQESDLEKDNFIAAISHELKTPISAIKASLELLTDEKNGKTNKIQKELINKLKQEAELIIMITNELSKTAQNHDDLLEKK